MSEHFGRSIRCQAKLEYVWLAKLWLGTAMYLPQSSN
jgi:hypothetical protein